MVIAIFTLKICILNNYSITLLKINTTTMKKLIVLKYSLVLFVGILLGFTLLSTTETKKIQSNDISVEDAKAYFQNYRTLMGYTRNQDNTSGYFDISQETLAAMLQNLKDNKYDKARVYIGQNDAAKPNTTIYLMNGMTSTAGKGYKEVNTGKIMTVSVKNGIDECPHYCDIMNTVLGAPQVMQSIQEPALPPVKKKKRSKHKR